MLKRKYFFSVKVSHDNGTGLYSWYSGMVTKVSWLKDEEQLLDDIRALGADMLEDMVDRDINKNDIQLLSVNKL